MTELATAIVICTQITRIESQIKDTTVTMHSVYWDKAQR